jgi:hypothetical protein
VAIVSHGYWKRYGSNAGLLGSQIIINGRPHSVVGVMPRVSPGRCTCSAPKCGCHSASMIRSRTSSCAG